MRVRIVVPLLVLGMTLVAGLAGGPASAASSKPVKGGTLTWGGICNNPKLDPAVAVAQQSACGAEMDPIYDVLLYEDPTDGYTLKYKLAESLTTKDNINWVLKLKPGLVFTDNTKLDAAAVKTVWERHKDPATKSTQAAAVANIASLSVVDPTTLDITLASAQPSFARTVARNLEWIPSPTAIAKYGTDYGTSPDTTVGAGPFVLKQWLKDSQLSYDRNPSYYDAPKPYFDHLVFLVNGDATALQNAFKSGQAQAILSSGSDAATQAKANGANFVPVPLTGLPSMQLLNVTIPPFNDIRVRQAFNMAMDPKVLNQVQFQGTGTVLTPNTMIPPSSPWHDPKATFPKYDPKKAQALFDEVAKETGKPVEIRHLQVVGDTTGEAVQTVMSKYQNVKIVPDTVTVTDYVSQIQQKKFQYGLWVCPGGTTNIQADPDPGLYDCFHSQSRTNISGYSNPEVDTLLTQGRTAATQKERKAAYDKVQEILVKDLPMIGVPIASAGFSYTLQKNVKGFVPRVWGPDFADMWLAKA